MIESLFLFFLKVNELTFISYLLKYLNTNEVGHYVQNIKDLPKLCLSYTAESDGSRTTDRLDLVSAKVN